MANSRGAPDVTHYELLAHGRAPSEPRAEVDPGTLAELAGTYSSPSGSTLFVRLEEEGHLTVQSRGRARLRLYAESDTSFYIGRGLLKLLFRRDAEGEVLGVRIDPSGSEEMARKVADESPSPRAVASGMEWSSVSFRWGKGMWALVGGIMITVLLVLVRWAVLSRNSTDP